MLPERCGATSGFVITLIATILLAVVVFSVPYAKSVYFLKASINQGVSGNITFGTLGYCLELPGNTTCSKPSIGYQLDINGLVGNTLPVKIPQVVVKWLTYALFIHVVALVVAAVSALFGLLAHVREMSMTCCSTCFSGIGAAITAIALIFDFVVFFVAKKRINDIGSAQTGSAIWLTLVAFILLLFSGCFYAVGRCCVRGRKSGFGKRDAEQGGPDKNYAEEVRLDAVKAEADRKARQKKQEVGLPAFDEIQPLTGRVEGDQVHLDGDKPNPSPPPSANIHRGYAPGRAGSRAVDDYYHNDNSPASSVYPPQREVRRQQSEHSTYSAPTTTTTASPPINNTRPSGYGQYNNAPMSMSPPPSNNQLLVPSGYHQQYNSHTQPDPYGREYGHTAGGTSYHTATSHDQGPSSYGQPMNDPYAYQPHQTQPQSTYQANPYMSAYSSTPMPQVTTDYFPPMSTSTSPPPIQQPQPVHRDRSYTLGGESYGGDGYGSNQLPPLPEQQPSLPPGAGAPSYLAFGQHQLPPIDTSAITGQHFQTSPGPNPVPNDSPPDYESEANFSRR